MSETTAQAAYSTGSWSHLVPSFDPSGALCATKIAHCAGMYRCRGAQGCAGAAPSNLSTPAALRTTAVLLPSPPAIKMIQDISSFNFQYQNRICHQNFFKRMNLARKSNSIRWWWTIGSGLASILGAHLALNWYPQAGFSQNPTGQFEWFLVKFAFTLSIPIALWQFLALVVALRNDMSRWLVKLVFWLPVTSIGIAAMILPLWWWSAQILLGLPIIAFLPLVPGATALAVFQGLILRGLLKNASLWIAQTIVGVVLGSVAGLIVASLSPLPIELTWAFVTVAAMCWPQGTLLTLSLPDRN
jgi:hypothetical protein